MFGIGRHVSAADLHDSSCAPHNLQTALAGNNPDRLVWNASYNKEYDGLNSLNVFTEINAEQYKEYLNKYGEKAQFIPTMNIFLIKPDMDGDPTKQNSGLLHLVIWKDEYGLRKISMLQY